MQDDLGDNFLDQMPFTIHVKWDDQLIELVIVPY